PTPLAASLVDGVERLLPSRGRPLSPEERTRLGEPLANLAGSAPDRTIIDVALRLADDEPLLEAMLAAVPSPRQPGVLFHLARNLSVRGNQALSERLSARCRPPLPPWDLEPVDPLPGSQWLRPLLRYSLPASVTDLDLIAAVSAAVSGDIDQAKARFAIATQNGTPLALSMAIGYAVVTGVPMDGLGLYREYGRRYHGSAGLAWNVACAYAAVGHRKEALESLRFFAATLRGVLDSAQRHGFETFLLAIGEHIELPNRPRMLPPATRQPAATLPLTPPSPSPSPTPPAEPAPALTPKEQYQAGDVQGAITRIRQILRTAPNGPEMLLLMRIYRQHRLLDDAIRTVEEIRAAGTVSWRIHVELARIALAANRPDVARDALRTAEELKASAEWTRPLWRELRTVTAEPRPAPVSATPAAESPAPTPSPAPSAPTAPPAPVPGTAPGHDVVQAVLRGQLQRGEWRQAVETGIAAGEQIQIADLTQRLMHLVPWAMDVALTAAVEAEDGQPVVDRLTDTTLALGDVRAIVQHANALCTAKIPEQALHLLERAKADAQLADIPKLALAYRNSARWAGLSPDHGHGLWPLLPAEPGELFTGDLAPELMPTPWVRTLPFVPAGSDAARIANQVTTEQGPVAGAEHWCAAVEDGYGVALPNALGSLVLAGRAAEALALHTRVRDTLYLTAPAAWNLGCAYAAERYFTAAAVAFEYFAQVSPRGCTPAQSASLAWLFRRLNRPAPMMLSSGGPPA
ncbi:MAG: hypothetical protein HKP61_03900, partial [Dactylosporangium sp.]|nr:hypothetical protein [Dactylosporangium sp.]NNJ60096.1 hypothetical protein [Dactylosporangium sp.]